MARSGEIDTLFEGDDGKKIDIAEGLKSAAVRLSVSIEAKVEKIEEPKKAEGLVVAYPSKLLYFGTLTRQVYCTLSNVSVNLFQTGEGVGIAYLTFTQNCGSSRSDVLPGNMWDWSFDINLYATGGAYIRNIALGTWDHQCGNRLVELRADFTWVKGSLNPVINTVDATLWWHFRTRVHGCG
ncbi:hypothetical protein [Pseudorhodoplanes sp.]|uniref:hypothetical protein n=1 Tax=Pseudorhodoplanes sp. TaxID=1934341 RepID=UPI003D152679